MIWVSGELFIKYLGRKLLYQHIVVDNIADCLIPTCISRNWRIIFESMYCIQKICKATCIVLIQNIIQICCFGKSLINVFGIIADTTSHGWQLESCNWVEGHGQMFLIAFLSLSKQVT